LFYIIKQTNYSEEKTLEFEKNYKKNLMNGNNKFSNEKINTFESTMSLTMNS
jgi:hypothetical protein